MKTKTVWAALALVASLAPLAAQAEVVCFGLKGTLTYGAPMGVPPGAEVTAQFSYDLDTPGYVLKDYAHYQLPEQFVMTFKIAGHTIKSSSPVNITLHNNYGGSTEDLVIISGTPPVLDGSTLSEGSMSIWLGNVEDGRALKNTKLPRKLNVKRFNAQGLTYGEVRRDGGQDGGLFQFSIDAIESHPKHCR